MSNTPEFINGKIVIKIPQVCENCGQEFVTTSTAYRENKRDPEWCEQYGFCTQNCMEYYHHYEDFKVQFKYRKYIEIIDPDLWATEWSIWVKARMFDVNPSFLTMEELFNLEYKNIVADLKIKMLLELGMSLEKAEWLAFNQDVSDCVWVKKNGWGFLDPGDESSLTVGW